MSDLSLTDAEIIELTHYRRAHEQLRQLREMGIPATRRHDNTVLVLRMHLMHPAAAAPLAAPQRKSART